MKKYLCVIEVKAQSAKEYVEIHLNPWREMLDAIKSVGYVNEVIYFYKNQSIIYLELPDELNHEDCNKKLRETDVCKKWDETVCPWFAAQPVMCEKIFDLNQQLEGNLLPD